MDRTVEAFQSDRYASNERPTSDRTLQRSLDKNKNYYNRQDQKRLTKRPARKVQKEKDQFVSNVQLPDPDELAGVYDDSAPVARTAQRQIELPTSPKQVKNVKPVSILNSGKGLEFDPTKDTGSDVTLPEPVDFSPEPAIETYRPVTRPRTNKLRRRTRMQDDDLEDPEDLSINDEDLEGDLEGGLEDELVQREENPLRKSCEEFRAELLNNPITDIALDISPPGNLSNLGPNTYRTWRDQFGNELTQGTIADVRRGYVVIDSSSGGQVRLPFARLGDAEWLAVSDYWNLPINCGLGEGIYVHRNWSPQTVTWHASSLCHKPLYFENVQLERYGHSHGPFLQPAVSSLHFFKQLFFLPYNTAINPPNECQYALGFYRPGNCAPWLKDPFPISLSGASRQALVYTGIGFLAD